MERYLFISFSRYGAEWLTRPIVIALFILTILLVAGAVRRQVSQLRHAGKGLHKGHRVISFTKPDIMYLAVCAVVGYPIYEAASWPSMARFGPMSVATAVLIFAALGFCGQVLARAHVETGEGEPPQIDAIHLDSTSDFGDLPSRTVLMRAGRFLTYLLGFLGSAAMIGFLPTVMLFVIVYMRVEGTEKWSAAIGLAAATTLPMYVVFDQALRIPWPDSWISRVLPALSAIPSV